MGTRHVVILEGGLGNQLFQFAYALDLAPGVPRLDNRRRGKWGEPLRTVLRPGTWQAASWAQLALAAQSPRVPAKQDFVDRAWRKLFGGHVDRYVLKEGASTSARQERAPVLLHDGYFQLEEFAARQRERVLASLVPSLMEAHPAVEESDSHVAVSFRLAYDYEYFGIRLPDAYYVNAIDHLLSGRRDPVLHVCADDQERAAALLATVAPSATVVDHSRASPVDQLRVLATARSVAVSNSTFAWWGAWMGDQLRPDGRLVLTPEKWLATSDAIMPARWLRVPVC